MATNEGTKEKWRKYLVPGAASLVGAGAGLALTRTNKLRESLPSLGGVGIGDLAEDLREKLSSITTNSNAGGSSSSSSRKSLDSGELEEHRRRRAERRKQRAGR